MSVSSRFPISLHNASVIDARLADRRLSSFSTGSKLCRKCPRLFLLFLFHYASFTKYDSRVAIPSSNDDLVSGSDSAPLRRRGPACWFRGVRPKPKHVLFCFPIFVCAGCLCSSVAAPAPSSSAVFSGPGDIPISPREICGALVLITPLTNTRCQRWLFVSHPAIFPLCHRIP